MGFSLSLFPLKGAAHIVDGEMKDWSRIREQKQMMNLCFIYSNRQ